MEASKQAKKHMKNRKDVREAVQAYQTETSQNKNTINISSSKPAYSAAIKVLSDQMHLCAPVDRDLSNEDLGFVEKNGMKIL